MIQATQWLCYNVNRDKYVEHHIVLEYVPKYRKVPKSSGKIQVMWDSMSWIKVYGLYDSETKEFLASRRNNDTEILHMFI